MTEVFLKILNMSIAAGWLVLAVMVLRLVLKKAPKWIRVLLWGFVAVRLICPFSFESVLSLIPSAQTVSPEIMMDWTPEISTGIPVLNSVINPVITESFAPEPIASANPLQILIPICSIGWLLGILGMLVYTAVSYLLLRRRVGTAVRLRENIFQSENVDSPFVLGIIKPRIYLPFSMVGPELEHVIAHEQAHIRRKDHWWKPLGFLLLAIHWFNPLIWIGYVLLCRDIELACDEKVIRDLDNEGKADYTQALVACSVNRRRIAACPLAFGEVGVKERVKSVMNYRKPAFWVILAAVAVCVVVAVCFLTNPKASSSGVLPDIHSHSYVVEEVVYEGGMYSFSIVAGQNSPIYAIGSDMQLFSQKEYGEDGQWTTLGQLEQITLTKENFDDRFQLKRWQNGSAVAKLRKNTKNAWHLTYQQEYLYYILQQKNGELYLAFGYQSPDPEADPGSFTEHIRWVYKLTMDATGSKGFVAKSGDHMVPMVSFPKGTVIGDYVDSVYWLTIDPGDGSSVSDTDSTPVDKCQVIDPSDKSCVPFTTWRDGEEIIGTYAAYDAQSFEPLKYMVPSGLYPQTYLFQNADPDRKYIVLAIFKTDEGTETYAFGAQFEGNNSDNVVLGPVEVIAGNLKTYYKNLDGTWQLDGHTYQHRLEISGRMPNAAVDSTFVYLSNLKHIGFTQAWLAAGLSSNLNDYFSVEEAVLVEWLSGDEVSALQSGGENQMEHSILMEGNVTEAIGKVITDWILISNAGDSYAGMSSDCIAVESHEILGLVTASGNPVTDQIKYTEEYTAYVQYAYHRYDYSGGSPEEISGHGTPAVIRFTRTADGGYTLKEIWEPQSGSMYTEEVRQNFPEEIAERILGPTNDPIDTEILEERCLKKALEYVQDLNEDAERAEERRLEESVAYEMDLNEDAERAEERCLEESVAYEMDLTD